MRGVASLGRILGAVAALLPLLSGFAAACHGSTESSPAPPPGEAPRYDFGDDFGYRLYLKSEGSATSLKPDPAGGDPEAVRADGLGTALATMGSGAPLTLEFSSAPTTHDLWFNLSKPLHGFIYVSSSALQGAQKRESIYWRTSVYVGDTFIGGDECDQTSLAGTGAAPPSWVQSRFRIRPETDMLPAGSVLKVKVAFYGSVSDFRVGTGGAQQSWIELRVASYDLLRTAVMLENHQLRYGLLDYAPSEEEAPEGAGGTAFLVGLPLLAAPLLAFAPRRRRAAVALLFLCAAFAGCMGGAAKPGSTGPGGPQPTVSTTSIVDPSLGGLGGVQGHVITDRGIPVRGAHVVLIGTANFTNTDGKGFFKILNVKVGTVKLRIDRDLLLPVEQLITIQAGRLLTVNVTMVPPEHLRGNKREHDHDDWGGQSKIDLWSGDFTPKGYNVVSGSVNVPGSLVPMCHYYASVCQSEIPILEDKAVLAGTGMVEVILTWSEAGLPVEDLALSFSNGKGSYRDGTTTYYPERTMAPRKSGQPFKIYMFPDEADPGHQKYTKWKFNVKVPNTRSSYIPWGAPLVSLIPVVHYEIKIHKGVVVAEPPHKDFWGSAMEKVLLVENKKSSSGAAVDHPGSPHWYHNDWKSLIPQGTKEIRGTLRWENTYIPLAQQTVWKLAYKPGNTPYSSAAAEWPALKRAEGTAAGDKLEFVIRPESAELDAFYLTNSNWMFFPDDGQDKITGTTYSANTGYSTSWYLTLKIVRDPEWKD